MKSSRSAAYGVKYRGNAYTWGIADARNPASSYNVAVANNLHQAQSEICVSIAITGDRAGASKLQWSVSINPGGLTEAEEDPIVYQRRQKLDLFCDGERNVRWGIELSEILVEKLTLAKIEIKGIRIFIEKIKLKEVQMAKSSDTEIDISLILSVSGDQQCWRIYGIKLFCMF